MSFIFINREEEYSNSLKRDIMIEKMDISDKSLIFNMSDEIVSNIIGIIQSPYITLSYDFNNTIKRTNLSSKYYMIGIEYDMNLLKGKFFLIHSLDYLVIGKKKHVRYSLIDFDKFEVNKYFDNYLIKKRNIEINKIINN